MKKKFVDSITNLITKHKECDELKIKAIRYGLEGVYSTLTKTLVIIIASICFGVFKETLLFLIFYAFLRKDSYGLHASNSITCWITTIIIYIGGAFIIKYISLNFYIYILIWISAFISFILWAPADTPKRPLLRKDKRLVHKATTCLTSIVYIIIAFFTKNIILINSISFALFIQLMAINPIIYWITKTPYNNYKLYKK